MRFHIWTPRLIGHDIAFPAMLRFLPAGWMGLMLGGLIAANSSTILTHLNWGASYLVHDFYRRFVKQRRADNHYVMAGRVATVMLFVGSSAMVFALDTAQDSFNMILQVGAGTGLLYLMRWFWWRVTAWCEIVAMVSSFARVYYAAAAGAERRGNWGGAGTGDYGDHDYNLLGGDGVSRPANGP